MSPGGIQVCLRKHQERTVKKINPHIISEAKPDESFPSGQFLIIFRTVFQIDRLQECWRYYVAQPREYINQSLK